MASITVFAATTGVNDSTVGTTNWTLLSNVSSDNSQYAFGDNGSSTSKYLRVPPQSLSAIPSGSTINGIEINVDRKRAGGAVSVVDNSVRLYKSGTGFVGSDKADGVTNWPTSDTVKTYGGAADLWGTTWTRDEIVNNLHFAISATSASAAAAIDYIQFTIYYTPAELFAGSGGIIFGGSVSLGGSLQEFVGSGGIVFGGTVIMPEQFAGEGAITFDGEVEVDFNFFFRWSIEHMEARTDYGFPTVWIEADNTSPIMGAFPSGSFFERRLLEIPQIQEVELDSRYGIAGFQQVTLVLDNSDGLFNGLNMQGTYIRMFFIDAEGNETREFKGQVVDWTLSHRVVLNIEDVDYLAIAQDLPKRTLNELIESEKIADGTFENFVVANDLGKPIPIVFGRAVKTPLLYVKANESAREYDYIIGEGEGLNGNNFQEVFTVYRNDQALDEINGDAQSGSSASALKLESGDQRPDSWYKYWWVEITAGPGLGDIRHVTAYDSATNIITPNTNFSATLTTSSDYKLTEWRFYDGSQASPYAGYAFIRFKKRMGVSGRTDPIYADVNGFSDETNSVRAIQSFLSNPDWGLGIDVDTSSFNSAAALSEISAMLCEGAITGTSAAIDIFRELLGFRDMVLTKADNIQISVDQAKTSSFDFGLGDETGWNNILTASPEIVHIHPNEKTRNLKVRYRKNNKETDVYQYELERSSSTNGVDRIINLPFIYDHETADRWLDYKRKRYAAAVKRLSLAVGQEGGEVSRGDLATLHIPSLGLVNSDWEVTGAGVVIAGQNNLNLVPYGSLPYTYVPITSEGGTLPVDESFDIPPDYTASIPDPVSGVSVTMSMGIVGFTASPFALLTWTAPEDNYGGAVISVKLHADATTLFRATGTYQGTTARIEGLVPGQLYDFLVESLNITGQYKGLGVLMNNGGPGYIAGGDSTAPATPTGLTGAAKLGNLVWTWTKNAESDVSHYIIEIYTATSGGSLLKRDIVPHENNASFVPAYEYQRQTGNLTTALVGALRVAAVDHSGNTSAFTARVGATTAAVARDDAVNNDFNIQESTINPSSAAFSGSASFQNLASVTITLVSSQNVFIHCSAVCVRDAVGTSACQVRVQRNGVTVFGGATTYISITEVSKQISFTCEDSGASAGSNTYTFDMVFPSAAHAAFRGITVNQFKR